MKINKRITSIPKHCSFESALASALNGANGLTNSFIDWDSPGICDTLKIKTRHSLVVEFLYATLTLRAF